MKTLGAQIKEPDPKAIHLIEKSFLSEELKKQYIVPFFNYGQHSKGIAKKEE